MNYQAIYNNLIQRGKNRNLEGYCERHHITPRCMGGNDNSENLVKLTAREHFVAHRLLTKIYPEVPKLKYAVFLMTKSKNGSKHFKVTSRTYQQLKIESSIAKSILQKGRGQSPEARAKSSASRKGKKRPPEATLGIRTCNIGKPKSEESKAYLSALNKGKKLSEETKAKMKSTKEKNSANIPNRICTTCGSDYKPRCLHSKMCLDCRSPKPCKCGCGEIVTSPGSFYKRNHAEKKKRASCEKWTRPAIHLCVCKFCNKEFLAGSSTGKMCPECKNPRLCKCGCGEMVISPGKYFKHSHNKENRKKFRKTCVICNSEFETTGNTGTFCQECRKPRECKCGCSEMVLTPGWFFKPNHDKELRASLRYTCTCKFCNKEYSAGSSTGKMCPECTKPRECKCGCGELIKKPGAIFRSRAHKVLFEEKIDK